LTDVPLTTQDRSIAVEEGEELELARQASTNSGCFAELYRRHSTRVYRYLLVRVSDTHMAQDLTSQTFLAALEGIQSYKGKGTVAAWLFGIARRQLALYWRGQRPILPLDAADHLPCPDPPLDQVVEERLRLERVARGLRGIAPERAEALALRIFGGLSAVEVGALLGKSEAAVKMLVHRAVGDLQARLGGEEGER
jgi:RNA polymerase sigma-70 factor (ECF subfamily)